jgi:hypothetical protein
LQKFIDGYDPAKGGHDEIGSSAMAALKNPAKSILVTSILRRAMTTGCIALWTRLQKTGEQIVLNSSLQEMTRNVDTNAVAPAGKLPVMEVEKKVLVGFDKDKVFNATNSKGNKPVGSRAKERMEAFCAWCFEQDKEFIIVAAGHSIWFRNFFKIFLPKNVQHCAKDVKMVNCGVVSFTLTKGQLDGDPAYRIEAETLTELYGGFEKKKSKPKSATSTNGSSMARSDIPRLEMKAMGQGRDKKGKKEDAWFCCGQRD